MATEYARLAPRAWIWRVLLLLAGCIATAVIGAELLGGGVLGWIMGGIILAVTGAPLLRTITTFKKARNAQKPEL